MHKASRPCPLCAGSAIRTCYPYAIAFESQVFHYHLCGKCGTAFVDPLPDDNAFALMYGKAFYHDRHYAVVDFLPYRKAAIFLSRFALLGSSVLDYGCGFGHFLKAIKDVGFVPYGVEFDRAASLVASDSTGQPVISVEDLNRLQPSARFDVLHLGDVLEHLPDPAFTLGRLLALVKPGGLFFVEGPLEKKFIFCLLVFACLWSLEASLASCSCWSWYSCASLFNIGFRSGSFLW
jgi:2-polyprenyl-3-methyl-5-hydroxy-6-metoxy-1,4-benzoquinol methylase